MYDPVQAFLVLIGAMVVVAATGAALTFAVCLVCRYMEWSPVNITVNYNDHRTTCE